MSTVGSSWVEADDVKSKKTTPHSVWTAWALGSVLWAWSSLWWGAKGEEGSFLEAAASTTLGVAAGTWAYHAWQLRKKR